MGSIKYMEAVRVSDEAWLVDEGRETERDAVFVEYRLGGEWIVRLTSLLYGRVEGPVEMSIRLASLAGMDDDALAEGITTHVLRAIPMRDARRRLAWQMTSAYQAEGSSEVLPKRFKNESDFALLAALFAGKAAAGEKKPLWTLAAEHGVSRNTFAARIRTARSLGLLTPEGEPAALTEKGRRALDADGGGASG